MKKLIILVILLILVIGAAGGGYWYFFASTQAKLKQHLQQIKNDWLTEKVLIDSLIESNRRTESWNEDKIKELDDQWQLEKISAKYKIIGDVTNNKLSSFLRDIKAALSR